MIFYRVIAPHFVAGIEFSDLGVFRCAPILQWVQRQGMSLYQFRKYCLRKGWHLEEYR